MGKYPDLQSTGRHYSTTAMVTAMLVAAHSLMVAELLHIELIQPGGPSSIVTGAALPTFSFLSDVGEWDAVVERRRQVRA